MVLRFKVWRLGWENRGKGEKHRWVLVLRDKRGIIRKVAHNMDEEKDLKRWFDKYNVEQRLEDMLATKKLKDHVRMVKKRIRRRGFKHQMSFYGVFIDPRTSKKSYRRYELFKAEKWTQNEVAMLHQFFKQNVPKSRAGVFVWHEGKLLVDSKDELTKWAKGHGRNKSSRSS